MVKQIILIAVILNLTQLAITQNKLVFVKNNSVFLYNVNNDSSYLIFKPKEKKIVRKIEKKSKSIIVIYLLRSDTSKKDVLIKEKVYLNVSKKKTSIFFLNDLCQFFKPEYLGNIPLYAIFRNEPMHYQLVDSLIQRSKIVDNIQFITHKGNIYKINEKSDVTIFLKHKKGGSLKFRFLDSGFDYIDIDNSATKIVSCDLSYKNKITHVCEININSLEKRKLFEIPKSKIQGLRYSEDGKYLFFMNSQSIDNQFIGNFIFDIKNEEIRKLPSGYFAMWL